MKQKIILLVEDNPDDEALILRALKKNKIENEVIVVRDGAEALEYLFATGKYAGRDTNVMPSVILLDLGLPKIAGLEVLQRLRDDSRTILIPVVILTSSKEQEKLIQSYSLGANIFVRKPSDFSQLFKTIRQLKLNTILLNEPAEGRDGLDGNTTLRLDR